MATALRHARELLRLRETWIVVAITLVALALRLVWVLSVDTGLLEYADMQWYYVTAKNIAEGHGMTVRVEPPTGNLPGPGGMQAVLWPPGYPLTLAAVFKLFGASLTAGKVLNAVISALTVPLVYLLARRVFGKRQALIAAALFALYPASIVWTSVLFSDTVSMLPFAAATVVLLYAGPRPSPLTALAFGALAGAATIIRPQAAVLIAAAAAYWWLRSEHKRDVLAPLAASVAGVCLFVVPISVWNSVRNDAPMLLSQNAGYNLRIGHAPYSTGRYTQPVDLWAATPNFDRGELPDEGLAFRRAIKYAVTHPLREIELSGRKIFYLYTTDSDAIIFASTSGRTPIRSADFTQRLMDLSDVAAFGILILAIASLPLTFSLRDERLALWLIVLFWTAAHVVFFGEPRFRLPILPIVLTFAAVTLVEAARIAAAFLREDQPSTEAQRR